MKRQDLTAERQNGKTAVSGRSGNIFLNFAADMFLHKILKKSCGLSYKYAGAVFKKETGMTIRQYQLFLRMERARKLLLETDLTISDIAALTGFYDAFHFSRMFSRENGISPDSFRRSYLPKI